MCNTELLQHHPGPLAAVDVRAKIAATLALLVVLALLPMGAWTAFAGVALLLLVVAAAGRVPMGGLALRCLVAAPFLMAAVPLAFSRPGPALWRGLGLVVTVPGAETLATIACRVVLSTACAALLASTTPLPELLRGLLALRVSPFIVSTIAFMHRYAVVLREEATRMLRAAASRSACPPGGRPPSALWRARHVGAMVGSLCVRSLERSERIHAAMLARGYDGRPRFLETPRETAPAPAWSAAAGVLLAGLAAAALWVTGTL